MSKRFTTSLSPRGVSAIGESLKFAFSGQTAMNRILNTSMTEHLASWDEQDRSECGVPGEGLVHLYHRWGQGQAGVILSGNIMVVAEALETRGNMIIPIDAEAGDEVKRFEGFKKVAKAGKADGSLMIAQISHPGRQVTKDIQPDPVSASDVQLTKSFFGPSVEFAKPHPATLPEIQQIVQAFVHAATYLETAGWDGVQLHGAHGYLLAQFLSRRTNLRSDDYGGNLENRARIIVEIARGIRSKCSANFILGIKLNSVEFQDQGLQPQEALLICQILEREKFDFVELSGGTYEALDLKHQRDSTKAREGFFLEFAEKIVPVLSQTKAYVTGGFKTSAAVVHALDSVDGVGMGRALAQEPDLIKKFLDGRVDGAIKTVAGEDDFFLTGTVAGAHMGQMAEGREPFDASDEDLMKMFTEKSVPAYMDKLGRGEFVSQPYMQ